MNHRVVILSYNHPQITERCVRSVIANGEKPILIHNGSRTENIELLRCRFPNIDHRILQDNRGFSGGANYGLREGFKLADKIFFLTNDCELTKPLETPRKNGILAPMIWRRKIGEVDSIGGVIDLRKGVARHARLQTLSLSQGRFYIPGSAFWIDQKSFESLGGFNEIFGTYWEDIELSLRAPQFGVELGTDPSTQVLHRVGKTCHKDAHYTSYLYQRNRLMVCWRYTGTLRFLFLARYLSSLNALIFRKARVGQWASIQLLLCAIRDGWRMRNWG